MSKESFLSLVDELNDNSNNGEETCSTTCSKPRSQATYGDKVIDLHNFFWTVIDLGGYRAVCVEKMWGTVLDKLGLDNDVVPDSRLGPHGYLQSLYETHLLAVETGVIGHLHL